MPRKMFRSPGETESMDRLGPDESGPRKRPKIEEKVIIDPGYQEEVQRVERFSKREKLMAEAADIKQREKEMRGIEGGESFLVEDDRLKEIEAELGIKRKPATKAIAKKQVMEISPVEFGQGVLKALEKKAKTIANEQKKVMEELKEYGIDSIERIHAELEKMEAELRAKAENKQPGFGYRFTQLARRMLGQELPAQAKQALEKYVDIETRLNANRRDMSEAQSRLTAPDEIPAILGYDRESLSANESELEKVRLMAEEKGVSSEAFDRLVGGFEKSKNKDIARLVKSYQDLLRKEERLRSELGVDVRPEASMRVVAAKARRAAEEQEEDRFFAEKKPVEQQQQENKDMLKVRAVWEVAADIEDAIKNFEAVKDDMDVLQDESMFQDKQNELAKRVRAMESQGSGKDYDEALQAAEDALARYAVALNRRLSRIRKEAATAGPGEARPESVIVQRAGRAGSYGTGSESRTRVEMSRMKSEKREAAPKAELVNKEIGMYRSEEWRKNLIDRINADENWRVFMHGVYEDVSGRMKQMAEGGQNPSSLGSPDAALDYTLALFRGHARRSEDNGFIYSESDRLMAQSEVKHWDDMFGWGERYKLKEEERAEPLKAEKRNRSKKELKKIEEEIEPVVEAATEYESIQEQPASASELQEIMAAVEAEGGEHEGAKPIEITLEEESPQTESLEVAEKEVEQGLPSETELMALARSEDMEHAQPKHEDAATIVPPSEEAPVMIEEPVMKQVKGKTKAPRLSATLEERLKASATKQTKSRKKGAA